MEEDTSGDMNRFTNELAGICADRGVKFRFGEEVTKLVTENGKVLIKKNFLKMKKSTVRPF